MVSPILIPENQRQPFPRDVGKVSRTKDKCQSMFLLRDEHSQGKLTVTGLASSRNWPQFLYGKMPKGFIEKRMSKDHKKREFTKKK